MAVLAGIALKVGIDILDWSFLKRAHAVSLKGAMIMYGVMLLTVFVDLIVAVGVGVFIANILTIERLSDMQGQDVKAITDEDDAIVMTPEEKQLLAAGKGRVLLFYLSGPMIFGVAKAISREESMIQNYDVLIFDLSDVPMLGVTACLAIENAIKDAVEKGRHVFIVGAKGKIKERLERFKIVDMLPPHHLMLVRQEALQQALTLINLPVDVDTFNSSSSDPQAPIVSNLS
jgi:SulP family sulfate permease